MSDKIRIYELAKELDKPAKEIIEMLSELNIAAKSTFSTIDKDTADTIKEILQESATKTKETSKKKEENINLKVDKPLPKKTLEKPKEKKIEYSISSLSKLCEVTEHEIELKLLKLGVVVTSLEEPIPHFAVKSIFELYGVNINSSIDTIPDPNIYISRAPVITVMGHVDHGKTTLLDTIRKTRVAEKELGGITQKIGAYVVNYNGKKIVFVDTPGHEAFTAMRSKGAEVTDIVILVVAADEGVRDQTIEAIDHAKAARVPIIAALNKIDKPNANPDSVKQQLSDHGLVPEEWGGDTIFVNISAKNNVGIDDLLEMIVLKAELMDLRTNTKIPSAGTVIESVMTKSFGAQATVIIQVGHLRIGDIIGNENKTFKVKAIYGDLDKPIRLVEALMPVKIAGIPFILKPGTILKDINLLPRSTTIIEKQKPLIKKEEHEETNFEGEFSKEQEEKESKLNLIIKADGEGTLDAVSLAVSKINVGDIKLNILHKAVGLITETDVLLASVSKAFVVGFNVTASDEARKEAKTKSVNIKTYRLIFDLLNDVKGMMEGKLKPKEIEKVIGTAEVKQVFKVSKIGTIAGCIVKSGLVQRNANVRIIRDRKIIADSKIISLKRFKDDAREVREGFECGIGIENYNDIKVGDILEVYELVLEK